MTQPTTRSRSPVAAHPGLSVAIALLVAVDVFLVLWVPLYSRLTPKWGDFPFFYWYLLISMPVTSLLLWVAAVLQKRLTAPGGAVRDSTARDNPALAGDPGSEDGR